VPHYQRARIGVKALVFRNTRLLLLHRRTDLDLNPGRWDLPGGGVEVGDGLVDSLTREVREETGFRVTVGPVVDVALVRSRLRSGERFTGVVVFYACSTQARGAPCLDPDEHSEFAWVGAPNVGRFPLIPYQSRPIRKAFRDLTVTPASPPGRGRAI